MDKSMTDHVNDYISMRRALGVELQTEAKLLLNFANLADHTASGKPLTIALALQWACSSRKASQITRGRRLEMIGRFARYLKGIEPQTEIPPRGILGPAYRRLNPKIYDESEIHSLLAAAGNLRPEGGLRPATIRIYLGLLACTGMRPMEPLLLEQDDVDLAAGTLTLQRTKFHKSRILPVHPSATSALAAYAHFRDSMVKKPKQHSKAFFLLDGGYPLTSRKLHRAFGTLRHKLGWTESYCKRMPRLYDLRHTFVCNRVLSWHSENVNVDRAMYALSTYLGHAKVTDTYWYLTGIPELMAVAGALFEEFTQKDQEV